MSKNTRPVRWVDALNRGLDFDYGQCAVRTDCLDGPNVIYLGYARPNAEGLNNDDYVSASRWRIQMFEYDGNNIIASYFAEGSGDWDQVWDDGVAATVVNVTQASPGEVEVADLEWDDGTAIALGDKFKFVDVVGMTELSESDYYIVGTLDAGNDEFRLLDSDGNAVNTSAYTAFTSATIVKLSYLNHQYY